MFPIVDTAAGMAFVYLLLSLVSSAIREAAESLLRKRSAALRSGINRLLGEALAQKLYGHGLVAPLADHPAGPSYIPPQAFSTALQDLMQGGEETPHHVRQVLRALELQSAGDAARFQAGLEAWFDSAMDAVSRAYQHHTRAWLALIGIAVTVAMNADSIRMAGVLFGNAAVAARAADAAENFAPPLSGDGKGGEVKRGPESARCLAPLGLPIGWTGATRDSTLPWAEPWKEWAEPWKEWAEPRNERTEVRKEPSQQPPAAPRYSPWWTNAWLLLRWHWAGWLITVAAITVGAPFWFDLLNQVVRFRQAGRPDQRRPDELG